MHIDKSSLAAALLELGEENAAVLLIRSSLPDQLDTEHDLAALELLGVDSDTIAALVATAENAPAGLGTQQDNGEHLRQTISRRYAQLVQKWVS